MSFLFPFGGGAPQAIVTPGGYTFAELWGDKLDIELASADRTELFTSARRRDAVNAAQDAFVRLTKCTKRYATVAIVSGTTEYDLENEIPDFIELAGAPSIKVVSGTTTRYIQGPDNFPRRDVEELDRSDFNWRAWTTGAPVFWYLREDGGSTFLGTNGTTSTDVMSWLVPYVADPPDMDADDDEPFSFDGNPIKRLAVYQQALVHGAAAALEPLRKNYTGVTRQTQMFSGFVAQYLQSVRAGGRDQIALMRDYYGAGRSSRPQDPRSWP